MSSTKQTKSGKKSKAKSKDSPKEKKERKFWKNFKEKVLKPMGKAFIVFLKFIWIILKDVAKVILAPFWYTGILIVKLSRFMKTKGSHPLTEEDKEFLSLIPTFYFMLTFCVTIIFIIFSEEVISAFWSKIFSASVGENLKWFFGWLGNGLAWFFVSIWNGLKWIVVSFGDLLNVHPFPSIIILLVLIILVAGLVLLLYYAPFTQKVITSIKNFFNNLAEIPKKIGRFFVRMHQKIKNFVLKRIVGEQYLETKNKTFFWSTTLVEIIVTILFLVITLVMGILKLMGDWVLSETLKFTAYTTGLLFIFVGIFSTWFFVRVLGVSTQTSTRFNVAE
ncbi:MAG: hypothetical protein ACTSYD_10670 [Candidatus Heimdallarchaeaceae archaeon]